MLCFKRNAENGGILVKEDVVHNTRLKLAVQGLPRGGHAGFELMENQKLELRGYYTDNDNNKFCSEDCALEYHGIESKEWDYE